MSQKKGLRSVARASEWLNRLCGFIRSEDGPTATEYAVMLAMIIVVAIGAIGTLGQNLWAWYTNIEATLFA